MRRQHAVPVLQRKPDQGFRRRHFAERHRMQPEVRHESRALSLPLIEMQAVAGIASGSLSKVAPYE